MKMITFRHRHCIQINALLLGAFVLDNLFAIQLYLSMSTLRSCSSQKKFQVHSSRSVECDNENNRQGPGRGVYSRPTIYNTGEGLRQSRISCPCLAPPMVPINLQYKIVN